MLIRPRVDPGNVRNYCGPASIKLYDKHDSRVDTTTDDVTFFSTIGDGAARGSGSRSSPIARTHLLTLSRVAGRIWQNRILRRAVVSQSGPGSRDE